MNLESTVNNLIEKNFVEWIAFLQKLVQVPSIMGEEQKCQAIVQERMKDMGIFDKLIFAKNEPPFHLISSSYENRPNVVGRIAGSGNSHFILNAHIDTVPIENEQSWAYPPFSGQIVDDKLYGRGALDDKSGIAMMFMLAECFLKAGVSFPGDIYVESVIGDEESGNGTLACTLAGYRADAGIIIDGTWPHSIIDAHLGQIWLDITITGTPVPACSHKRGYSPVDAAVLFIQKMKDFINIKNSKSSWFTIEDPLFFNVGAIHAGVWHGAFPEICTMQWQVGFPPPDTPESMIDSIKKIASKLNDHYSITIETGNLCCPPFANRDNKMVSVLKNTISRLRGDGRKIMNNPVTGHSDLRHIIDSSGKYAHACLYGPGGGINPHVVDEYYKIDHFVEVAQNIAGSMLSWYNLK
jgi:acetylornithine deacetylase